MLRTLLHNTLYPIKIVPGSMLIPIGRTSYGKIVYLDLKSVPHTKIAGLTGMGKSSMMLTILYFICMQLTEARIEIIDLKGGATYAAWINVPQVKGIYPSTEHAMQVLESVEQEMWRRVELVRQARADFKKTPTFPMLMVLIDEGGEMSPSGATGMEEKIRQRCMKLMSTLVRVGRESGVRVVYGTQRPDATHTLPANIRGQLDHTICFRVREKGESKIVLGHEGAEELMVNPGRAIYQMGVTEVEFQAAYIDEDTLTTWLMSYAKRWQGVHGA